MAKQQKGAAKTARKEVKGGDGVPMAVVINEVGRRVEIPERNLYQFIKTYPDSEIISGTPENPIKRMTREFTAHQLVIAVAASGVTMPKNPSPTKLAALLIDEGGADFVRSVLKTHALMEDPDPGDLAVDED